MAEASLTQFDTSSTTARPLEYTYEPLNEDEFRLLTLLPNTSSAGPVRFQLTKHTVSSPPEFFAVSYAWEDQARSEVAVCEGAELFITPTVEDLLQSMLAKDEHGPFFIDAISIHQFDAEEKAAQVRILYLHFAHAAAVIVWLGNSSIAINQCIECLLIPFDDFPRGKGPHPNTGLYMHTPEIGSLAWSGLYELFEKGFWRRLWPLQELVLNTNVEICCGREHLFSLESLCWFAEYLVQTNGILVRQWATNMSPASGHALEFLRRIEGMQTEWREHSGLAASSLIEFCRSREVSLQIDRVFAVLGLLSTASRSGIPVDYATASIEDPRQQFLGLGLASFADDVCLTGLQQARIGGPSSMVPTWCPDVSQAVAYQPLHDIHEYQAGGESSQWRRQRIPSERVWDRPSVSGPHAWLACSRDRQRILMRGTVVGMVRECGLNHSYQRGTHLVHQEDDGLSESRAIAESERHWLKSWAKFCRQNPIQVDDQVNCDADEVSAYRRRAYLRCPVGNAPFVPKENSGTSLYTRQYDPPIARLSEGLAAALDILDTDPATNLAKLDSLPSSPGGAYLLSLRFFMANRTPLRAFGDIDDSKEWLGIGPGDMREGDYVVVFRYARVPFILRRRSGSGFECNARWHLIGEAYVEGLMEGELFEQADIDDETLPCFWIE
ncbi:uncharacterized protein AB675_11728 [Cyphellophora attinorum]|uniref:Heterokaryon incompatibility domain-containing protein n=1 Tax=Cyphellophora attinorum TaxID=1664694 RepID=A0A0N1H3G8_9EURO|nr:uncharacterized protein AB675_11728 [Phialophora attinorum]KPI35405.1 hypothetical protein AB675_11728 [Phialophora attinorum]